MNMFCSNFFDFLYDCYFALSLYKFLLKQNDKKHDINNIIKIQEKTTLSNKIYTYVTTTFVAF